MIPRHIAGVGEHSLREEDLDGVEWMATSTVEIKAQVGFWVDLSGLAIARLQGGEQCEGWRRAVKEVMWRTLLCRVTLLLLTGS